MTRSPRHHCPACGSSMDFEARDDTIEYKGASRTVPLEGWWCNVCGEAILEGPSLEKSEHALNDLKAEVDGILRPHEITSIREKLGLSQRQASEVLGGGPRAFQKYESGEVLVSQAMSNLLRLLGNDPRRLVELRAPTTRVEPRGDDERSGLRIVVNSLNLHLQEEERRLCEAALEAACNIVDAAALLGITRHALKRRIIKHRIRWPPEADGKSRAVVEITRRHAGR